MSSTLVFRLATPVPAPGSQFSARLGTLTLARPDGDGTRIQVPTPGLLACTTRGVIQHLSRDNVRRTPCLSWVHVPFESFLQIDPPIPTLQKSAHPLHTFLGFPPAQMIVSMSLRDPADVREMPPNGKLFVAAQSSRGARKVTPAAYRAHAAAVQPDIIFPLSDVPFTPPPHSQKRTDKSIERSTQWLASILTPLADASSQNHRPSVFLPMIGGIKPAARAAFANAIQEPLEPKEKELLAPLATLDEGVAGYVFDLAPLRAALLAEATFPESAPTPAHPSSLPALLRDSLAFLPAAKPRLATSPHSPHEILTLIQHAGIDLFDSAWAQRAAAWGVALDFTFPAPLNPTTAADVGHNLYDTRYAHDFCMLSTDCPCACAACAPTSAHTPLVHSSVDNVRAQDAGAAVPYTRAYLHHLLHTHEMSAHALLVMHNLTVVDAFMRGVRGVLEEGGGVAGDGIKVDADAHTDTGFAVQVARFGAAYDGALRVLDDARACWHGVDQVRGKGRLARERARKAAEELGLEGEVAVGAPVEVEVLEG